MQDLLYLNLKKYQRKHYHHHQVDHHDHVQVKCAVGKRYVANICYKPLQIGGDSDSVLCAGCRLQEIRGGRARLRADT